MTCIVGLIDNDRIYMGWDSASSWGYERRAVKNPKVVRVNDNMLIGVTGYWRPIQIIQYHLHEHLREDKGRESAMAYMVKDFIPALRETMKEHGFASVENGEESYDSTLLVATHRNLFEISSNFQVVEVADAYTAIGSGHTYALGALHALESIDPDWTPDYVVNTALKAAARFNAGCCPPFYVESLEMKEKYDE